LFHDWSLVIGYWAIAFWLIGGILRKGGSSWRLIHFVVSREKVMDSVKLNYDDVIHVPTEKTFLNCRTFKVEQAANNLAWRTSKDVNVWSHWASSGIECEVLKTDGRG
jgi:hypothetical protein